MHTSPFSLSVTNTISRYHSYRRPIIKYYSVFIRSHFGSSLPSMSDDEFLEPNVPLPDHADHNADDSDEILEPVRRRHRIPHRAVAVAGALFCFALIVDFNLPPEPGARLHVDDGRAAAPATPQEGAPRWTISHSLTTSWRLVTPAQRHSAAAAHFPRRGRVQDTWAFVEYYLSDKSDHLDLPLAHDPTASAVEGLRWVRDRCRGVGIADEFCARIATRISDVLVVSSYMADLIMRGSWPAVLQSVPLPKPRRYHCFRSFPPRRCLDHFARLHRAGAGAQGPFKTKHGGPAQHKSYYDVRSATDPVHLLRWSRVTLFLRNLKGLVASSKAHARALWPKRWQNMMDELIITDGYQFPGASTMVHARPRIDVAGMILLRQKFANRSIQKTSNGHTRHYVVHGRVALKRSGGGWHNH